jgi:hypothetical protein
VLAPILAFNAGCGGSDAPQERRIVPHAVPGCVVSPGSGLVLTALGDFSDPAAASLRDPSVPNDVALPFSLRGVATSSMSGVRGVGYADPPSDVHLSLWSSTESCTPIEDVIPPSHGGQAMTALADGTAVVVAGLDPMTMHENDSASGLVWDTRTGEKLVPYGGLSPHRRAWASATAFGKGALIAGGVDRGASDKLIDTAMVYRDGGFKTNPDQLIPLGDPRSRQGATVLADGSTLLVGGETENHLALPSLVDVVPSDDPPYGHAIIFGLGTLRTPRKDPTVLRLADDTILVAGGVDSMDQPVSTLEWFTKEGFACDSTNPCPEVQTLPVRQQRAFVALPAGGALAVGVDSDPSTKTVSSDVWWITPNGDLQALAPLTDGQLPELDESLQRAKNVRLIPGSDGSPWLWTGAAWFRFDPWLATFVTPSSAPIDGPDDDLPIISVDSGLMVWLDRERAIRDGGADATPEDGGADALETKVRGFRYDVRGPLVRDTTFALIDPQHIVPDRPPGTDIQKQSDGVHLANGATLVIADALFGDAVIQIKVRSTSPPAIKLGSIVAVGADACPWSSSTEAGSTATTGAVADAGAATDRIFEVRRTGTRLDLRVGDANDPSRKVALRTCPGGPQGRVSIGLTAPGSSPVVVSELTVTRTASP